MHHRAALRTLHRSGTEGGVTKNDPRRSSGTLVWVGLPNVTFGSDPSQRHSQSMLTLNGSGALDG